MDSDTRTRHVRADGSIVTHVRFDARESDGNTLVGLAVPFWSVTPIRSPLEGEFDEQFADGSLKRTLTLRTPILMFDHGTHPMLGQIPIGHFSRLKETERGLDVVAPIFDNWMTEPVRDAIRAKTITGMSVRFRPIEIEITEPSERTDGGTVELRTIREAELIELGPVVFPAYADTSAELRDLNLNDKMDRRRLAQALVSCAVTGQVPDESQASTREVAESPADTTSPDSLHLVGAPRQRMKPRQEFFQKWISQN